RKIDYPQKFPVVGANRELATLLQQRRRLQSQPAENGARLLPWCRRKEHDVALGHAEFFRKRRLLSLGEKFHDRRFPLTALDFDEREPLGAERLGDFLEVRSEEHTSALQSL